jgi:type I restriction enzyme S subunit
MIQYSSYKDSGIEWIGEIPSHWDCVKTNKVFKYLGSGTTPTSDNELYYEDGIHHWITTTDLNEGIMYDTLSKLTDYCLSEYDTLQLFPRYSIYISMYGGRIGKIGLSTFDSYCNQSVCVLPNNQSIVIKYYYYWFLSNQDIIKSMGRGGGQPNISKEMIKEFNTLLPPISEQEHIVSYLDDKTTKIDELIQKKLRKIDLLKEYRTSIINTVVTKGLNPDVPMKDSGIEWIGEIPSHWEVKRLKYTCDVSTGSRDTQDRVDNGKYPFFVRSPNVERIDTYSYDGEGVLTVGDGVGTGKVFHYFNGKFEYHQRVYLFSNFRHVLGKYFYLFMKEQFIYVTEDQNSKSTVDSLRRPLIDNFRFILPPLSEQEHIVSYLDEKTSQIDKTIDIEKKKIELLKEYRQSLISNVVTGKIKVIE